ncbi:hypothetical protein PIB30_038553 [Stylosanthes scabra]|uniref:Uncharacterized protein n=1 Tax=Stylosanthes scabra TaxID=79078 RepID=A0ABU6YEF0_9FABA|nr:hypothetical protein [Stylosanthes scabra]
MVGSSSQPPPTNILGSPNPKQFRPGTGRGCVSSRPQQASSARPKTKSATQPKSKSVTQPRPRSATQPTATGPSQATSKPSSSQLVGKRPIFCVRNVNAPHVSPKKLRFETQIDMLVDNFSNQFTVL